MKNYVLDSYALLAYVNGEEAGRQVEDLFNQAETGQIKLFLSTVNLTEVIYIIERKDGPEKARIMIGRLQYLPIAIIDVNQELALETAHLKANHPISLADCFALALAKSLEGCVVTGDPEFSQVKEIPVQWLSPKQ